MEKEKNIAKKALNLDYPARIAELKYSLRDFKIRTKLFRLFYRGKSYDFDGYREYTPEDDATCIDWKASSRSDKLLVKQYKEEEEKKICFFVDVSDNMVFGSCEKLKCEYAAELALAIAYLANISGFRIGLVLFTDRTYQVIEYKRGIRTYDLFINYLSDANNYGGKCNLKRAFEFLSDDLSPSTTAVIIFSDFINMNNEARHALTLAAARFETLAFLIKDPLDLGLPDINREIVIENPMTSEKMIIDPSIARKQYEEYALEKNMYIRKCLRDSGVDFLELITDKPFIGGVTGFINDRIKYK